MAWRIHLTNQAIRHLDILPGKQPALIVWTRRDRLHYYDLESGALLGEHTLPPAPDAPRQSDSWQEYVGGLTGYNERTYLPYVETPEGSIYATDDGKMRLYRTGDTALYLENDGVEVQLPVTKAERFVSVDLDGALGMVVALDENSQLHVYQQDIHIGKFDLGLEPRPELRSWVVVSRGGGKIFASDGRRVVLTDSSGRVIKRETMHYYVGRIACSPGGGMLVTSDLEAGVMRLYRGDDLTATHQRFAIDLLASAQQVQLLADMPPMSVAVSALVAHSKGVFAFAMSGVICTTDVSMMDELPRPQALL